MADVDQQGQPTLIRTFFGPTVGWKNVPESEIVPDDAMVVNVKDYGALGDGITNDAVAIQAAIAAAEAKVQVIVGASRQGGGCVFFPAGTYRTFAPLVSVAPISFLGVGRLNSNILADHTAGALIITPNAPSGEQNQWLIERLGFQARVASAGTAITFNGVVTAVTPAANLQIKGVQIAQPASGSLAAGFNKGIVINNCWNSNFEDLHIIGQQNTWGTTGIELGDKCIANYFTNINISGFLTAIDVPGLGVEGIYITHCTMVSVETGFRCLHPGVQQLAHLVITDSHCASNLGCVNVEGPILIMISDCLFFLGNTGSHVVPGGASTIRVVDVTECIITSNIFRGALGSFGIRFFTTWVTSELRCMVSNNVFFQYEAGIWLDAGSSNMRIGPNNFSSVNTPVLNPLGGTAASKILVLDDGLGGMTGLQSISMIPSLVSALPTAGTAGRRRFVTDATVATFGTVVAGAGANQVPVYDDGTNWRIG